MQYFRRWQWLLRGRQRYRRDLAAAFDPEYFEDGALVAAWRRFVDYDVNANQRRDTDRRLRLAVIYLASVLVVLAGAITNLYLRYSPIFRANEGSFDYPAGATDVFLYEDAVPVLSTLALVLLVLAIYAYLRTQTSANAEYYAYRLAETLIQREIFLYRLGAGRYLTTITPRERQQLLTNSLKAVEERVKQMGVRPVNSVYEDDRTLWTNALFLSFWIRDDQNPFSTYLPIEVYLKMRIEPMRHYFSRRADRADQQYIYHQVASGVALLIGVITAFNGLPLFFIAALFLTLAIQVHADIVIENAARLFYESSGQRLTAQLDEWKSLQTQLPYEIPSVSIEPADVERQQELNEQARAARARLISEFIERVEDTLQFATEMWVLNSFFRSTGSSVNQQAVINDLMQNGLALINRQQHVSPIRYAKNAIFISYRRADSEDIVGRVWDRLSAYFGQDTIFRDVQTISAGEDFEKRILSSVNECSVLLTIIGTEWERCADAKTGKPRLHEPGDYVRREIAVALARPDAIVVPVLVRGAKMPLRDNLPDDLHELTMRNGMLVRTDPDFDGDMKRLIMAIENSVRRA